MINLLVPLFCALFFLSGCSPEPKTGLKVVASSVPHAQLLEFVKPDLASQGINLIIVVSDDYNIPNRALANHEVDANFFQHIPFMEEQIKQFHYDITCLASIELEPMGIYSKKISSIGELKDGATIVIPNDPTNEARALLLLQEYRLIELDNPDNLQATVLNIKSNPKQLKFIEVDAAMTPRTLDDVDAAAINTNYALEAGLSSFEDSLISETKESRYANIIVVRVGDEHRSDLQALKDAMTSQKMRDFILKKYQGAVLPAF